MTTNEHESRRERAAHRALARSTVFRLLSQCLAYPTAEAVAALREVDLPDALNEAAYLPTPMTTLLEELAEQLVGADAPALQLEHRRVFSHVLSADCPPCETTYTAQHLFQETLDLSDLGSFFRAFGLEVAEKERPDHISVELEFMHVLTYKEAYAYIHHGLEQARLCREAQRTFMRDHLGCWARPFAERLREKAGGGYFAAVASLTDGFVAAEIAFLRARPEAGVRRPDWGDVAPDDDTCPGPQACPLVEIGGQDALAHRT